MYLVYIHVHVPCLHTCTLSTYMYWHTLVNYHKSSPPSSLLLHTIGEQTHEQLSIIHSFPQTRGYMNTCLRGWWVAGCRGTRGRTQCSRPRTGRSRGPAPLRCSGPRGAHSVVEAEDPGRAAWTSCPVWRRQIGTVCVCVRVVSVHLCVWWPCECVHPWIYVYSFPACAKLHRLS